MSCPREEREKLEKLIVGPYGVLAVNSRGRGSNLVPVDYCLARYVKKPSGAKPGKVIFTNYQTAFVKPDTELEEKLKV